MWFFLVCMVTPCFSSTVHIYIQLCQLLKKNLFIVWRLMLKLLVTQSSTVAKLSILDVDSNFGLSSTHTHTIRFIFLPSFYPSYFPIPSFMPPSLPVSLFSNESLETYTLENATWIFGRSDIFLLPCLSLKLAWNACKALPFSSEHSHRLW